MSATVTLYGKTRTVTNLGWLLRNWKRVERFEVKGACGATSGLYDVELTAHIHEAGPGSQVIGTYKILFVSRTVLARWLDRPVFRGVSVDWMGTEYKAGEIPPL